MTCDNNNGNNQQQLSRTCKDGHRDGWRIGGRKNGRVQLLARIKLLGIAAERTKAQTAALAEHGSARRPPCLQRSGEGGTWPSDRPLDNVRYSVSLKGAPESSTVLAKPRPGRDTPALQWRATRAARTRRTPGASGTHLTQTAALCAWGQCQQQERGGMTPGNDVRGRPEEHAMVPAGRLPAGGAAAASGRQVAAPCLLSSLYEAVAPTTLSEGIEVPTHGRVHCIRLHSPLGPQGEGGGKKTFATWTAPFSLRTHLSQCLSLTRTLRFPLFPLSPRSLCSPLAMQTQGDEAARLQHGEDAQPSSIIASKLRRASTWTPDNTVRMPLCLVLSPYISAFVCSCGGSA